MDEDDANNDIEETKVTNFSELTSFIRDDLISKSFRNVVNFLKNKKESIKNVFVKNVQVDAG